MSYGDTETSLDDARPIELYEITHGADRWYYTSADHDVTVGDRVYTAVPITRGEVDQALANDKSGLGLTFPHNAEFTELFRVHPPSAVVSITCRAQNFLTPGEYIVFWKGRILNCDWKWPWVELVTESIFTSTQRAGLRRRYSITCPYPLYSPSCGVARTDHRVSTVASSVSAYEVEVISTIGSPDNFFAGGMITWGVNEKRMIVASNGTTGVLTLASMAFGLAGGDTISLYPGCDHSISTCDSKFNNKDNCGAMPYIPQKNPFGGSALY